MLDEPVALITGTSKGIGLGLARYFLAQGYRVAGCSRSESPLVTENYLHTPLSVADEQATAAWVRGTRQRWGRVDVLVCNAGFAPATHLLAMTDRQVWDAVVRTNVDGAFFALREVARIMTKQRAGRIVTITSMAAALHLEGTGAYAASKAALVEMTKVLARELASSNVTCNAVGVSMVMTDAADALGETVRARAVEKLTLKRPLTVDEVCGVVGFLCSDAARTVTGQVIQMGLVT